MDTRPVLFLCAVYACDFSTEATTESGAGATCGSSAVSGLTFLGLVPVVSASGTSNSVATDSPGRLRRSGAGREGRGGAATLDAAGLLAAAGADKMGSVHQDGSCGGASLRSES